MATVFMSPGIYTEESDQSQFVQILTSTILAVVITASKGPTDSATFISTYDQFVSTFGQPSAAHPGTLVCRDFLQAGGNQLWVVRVANNPMTAAMALPLCDGTSVSVPASNSGDDNNNIIANISFANQRSISYATSQALVLFDQETATIGGTVTTGDTLSITLTNSNITGSPVTVSYTTVLGDTLNSIAAALAHAVNVKLALIASNISATVLGAVVTISAPESIGAVVYSQNVTGAATETITLSAGLTAQSAPQTFNLTLENTATTEKTVTLTGTATIGDKLSLTLTNSNITGSPVTVSYTVLTGDTLPTIATGLAKAINAQPGLALAGITALATGDQCGVQVPLNLGTVTFNSTVTGAQTETITLGNDAGDVPNSPIVPGTLDLTVNGSGGTITDDRKGNLIFTPATCGIAGTTWSGTIDYNTGILTIKVVGVTVGSTLSLVPTFSFYQTFTMQLFYQYVNATTSQIITTLPLFTYSNLTPLNFQANVNNTAYVGTVAGTSLSAFPKAGRYQFSGGTDGTAGLTDAAYIGVQGQNPTGLQIFSYADQIDINTLCVPGQGGSVAIRQALIELVTQARQDTIALLAPSQNENSPQLAVEWANGTGAYSSYGVIDNSFTALYFPWYMTYNSTNASFESTPPEAAAAAAFARSDYFEAPAGLIRGMVNNVTSIPPLSQGDRDFLYYNRINPISNLQGMGIMVSGQKTATLVPSSLDRVGARKVLSRLEKATVKSLYPLLFQLDNALTWQRAEDIIQPTLDALVSAGILRYGKINVVSVMSGNPTAVANNQMICNITLKLPKYAEFIVLNFIIVETGPSSINENLVPSSAVS